jgi:hypothetical protein
MDKKTGRGLVLRFLCAGIVMMGLVGAWGDSLWAGEHVVRIERQLTSEDAGEDGFNATARNKGFARAVLEEVSAVLGSELDQAREKAVLEILSPRVQDFVLSFSEQTFVEEQGKAVLQLNVRVNAQAVKGFLQRWGTYYTGSRQWEYALRAQGLDAKGLEAVRTLELMSGLSRAQEGGPVLELKQTDGSWRGQLRFEDHAWKAREKSLQELWPSLWSRFFHLPSVRSRVQVGLELRVSGWSSFVGLKDFDRRMQGWSQLLDRATLQEVGLQGKGVSGRWLVRTLHADAFKRELRSFLEPRGLRFALDRRPGRPGQRTANATRSEEAEL